MSKMKVIDRAQKPAPNFNSEIVLSNCFLSLFFCIVSSTRTEKEKKKKIRRKVNVGAGEVVILTGWLTGVT